MKRIIGILGVAAIAVTMFFSANTTNNSNTDMNLANLISLNTANAECQPPDPWGGGSRCLVLSGICVGDAGGPAQCKW